MLSASRLTKTYRTTQVETTAVDSVDLEIGSGEFVVLMGPSGCGKSTLLNLLGLLDTPSAGRLELRGQDVSRLSERDRARLRRGNVGYIFQDFHLIGDFTVARNVELPLLYLKMPKEERSRRVKQALEEVNLLHRGEHYPGQLSGGQQQRAAIARAIVARPPLILADEPTGNLDSKNGEEIMKLLSELNRQGTSIVMATHSSSDAEFGHRILRLYDGRVVAEEARERRAAEVAAAS